MNNGRMVKAHVEFDIELDADVGLGEQDIIGIINEMDYDFTIGASDCEIIDKEMVDCVVTIFEDSIKRIIDGMIEDFDDRDFQGIVRKITLLEKVMRDNQEYLDIEINGPRLRSKRRKSQRSHNEDDLGKLAEDI